MASLMAHWLKKKKKKKSACHVGDTGLIPGLGRFPWKKDTTTHSIILAWEIQWTEEPGRAMVHGVAKSQRVGHG